MSTLPYVLGGGALAAYLWSRGRESYGRKPTERPERLDGEWVWPVPAWNGRTPVVSDGFDSRREGRPRHGGVDIMFKRAPSDSFRPGTPNGSKGFVMPDNMVALAAADGVVWSAKQTPHGLAVVIQHDSGYMTFYTHLERLFVQPTGPSGAKQRVRAGQPIGIIGSSPLDKERLKHLHFELWRDSAASKLDPVRVMQSWNVLADPREKLVARNGALVYRPVGARGERYPQWVRDLKGSSGVYVIRERESREIVYVGSSQRRLYATLTRHFQVWRRFKGFWRGQYAEGHDPGLTYERGSVEVAVRITRESEALDEEARLIQRLRPRDNLLGQPTEEVPF